MAVQVRTKNGIKDVYSLSLGEGGVGNFSFTEQCRFQYPETVVIPSHVNQINMNSNSLYGHTEIKELQIAPRETLLTFYSQGCRGCSNLSTISIPEGTKIAIQGPDNFKETAITDETVQILYKHSAGEVAASGASGNFSYCHDLKNLEIPYLWGGYDFYNCYGLETVKITDSGKILPYAFQSCTNLQEVVLLSESIELQAHSFYLCSKLSHFEIPTNCTIKIAGDSIFSGAALSGEEMANIVAHIQEATNQSYIFSSNPVVEELTVPVDKFSGSGIFYQSPNLKKVTITSGTVLPNNIFAGCDQLKTVILPSELTTISSGCFGGCAITDIQLPEQLTTIGSYAFNSNLLTEINIPASVQLIAGEAFSNNSSLKRIKFNGLLAQCNNGAFRGCSNVEEIIIPANWNLSCNMSMSNNLTHECLVNIINNLASVETSHTLTIGSTNLGKLSDDEIAIATGKGWVLS